MELNIIGLVHHCWGFTPLNLIELQHHKTAVNQTQHYQIVKSCPRQTSILEPYGKMDQYNFVMETNPATIKFYNLYRNILYCVPGLHNILYITSLDTED